ncbi:MAG: S41 family peptidase [Ignavibacteriales bacterium]|nr:S41 family peptidase [Ignavibacteriales bacterium]
MKKVVLFIMIITFQVLAQSNQYFLSDPSLSPDGATIVFSYDSDLWSVQATGGKAFRLTGMGGIESRPQFSPDGKWIAFTSTQNGSANVYLLPVDGGAIKQLTFHSAGNNVESWSWDSEYIYFTSGRYNSITSYKVSIDGGTPVRLFPHFFNWPHNIVEDPLTHGFYFNDSWESSIFTNRKHYKGEFHPDIKFYNPATKEFKVLTNYSGKDFWQTVDKNGKIYFVSDEANDEYNLYTFENTKKKQLTDFPSSIKKPRVSANGQSVVFEKDYQIYLYDVNANKTIKVPISIGTNNTLSLEQEFNTKGALTNFNLSGDGKKFVFVSRGELFVSDIEGKFTKQITVNPNERITEVAWLGDNETILFTQTVNGWLNLFTIKADGISKEKQITSDNKNNRSIILSNDKTKAVYLSGRDELKLLDLKDFSSKTIVTDEFWALDNDDPQFSPDDKFVLYAAMRNFEKDIFVYDLTEGKAFPITKTGVTESSPVWSPDGKYIYFQTDRLKASYPRGTSEDDIYRIALQLTDKEFKSDRYEKLFVTAKDEKKDSVKPKVTIDFTNIKDRWEAVAKLAGNQNSPYVYQKGDETRLFFVSNHEGEFNFYQTILKPFDKPETKKFEGAKGGGYIISRSKENYFLETGGKIYKVDFAAGKLTPVETEIKFTRNLAAEFKQMYYETWANLDENYYDEKFHGANWEKLRDYYSSFLPFVNNRANLRILLNDLLGELNSSHIGFNSNGDEEKVFYKSETFETGIIFENDSPYKVKYIVKNSSAYKKGAAIQPGDELVAFNGQEINKSEDRNKYFTSTSIPEEITLTFKRGENKFDVKIHPQSNNELKSNLYDEWIDWNQKYVDEKSNNRIAYTYMKNMGPGELDNFIIDMTTDEQYKDGLILDLRYNTGGNVHNDVLNFLSQRPYLKWKYREGKFTIQPNFAPASKPIVLLINEQSLSDAEMTSAGFKQLGLGKIIGTESYRWIIFTSGKSLVDGSFYRLPSWGCYTLDGQDLEHTGVKPDIYVKTSFKDRLENKDPQLDRAIEEISKQLK